MPPEDWLLDDCIFIVCQQVRAAGCTLRRPMDQKLLFKKKKKLLFSKVTVGLLETYFSCQSNTDNNVYDTEREHNGKEHGGRWVSDSTAY